MKIPPYIGYPILAAISFGIIYVLANRQVYQPMKYPGGWWEVQDELGAEDTWIDTPDGVRLHGWWAPVPASRFVTLYLHGNAGNVSHRGSHIRAVNAAGSSILVIDYRGYGKSGGRPSENGLYRDAETAYRSLIGRGFTPDRIILHAESLGTSVAVDLATRVPVAGVILEAPFTSAGDVANRILPLLGGLMIRGFKTKKKVTSLTAPLLVIHGEEDNIIDFSMGRRLYGMAPEPKSFWAIPGAGHNDIVETSGPAYVERLRSFYQSLP